jgi:hypothetical protein
VWRANHGTTSASVWSLVVRLILIQSSDARLLVLWSLVCWFVGVCVSIHRVDLAMGPAASFAGCFADSVELSRGVSVPSSLRDTVVCNSSIAGGAYVAQNTLLANVVVMDGAAVVGNGTVSCNGPTAFANGMKLPLGLDGHGRETLVWASITVPEAAQAAQHLCDGDAYATFVKSVVARVTKTKTFILCVVVAFVLWLAAMFMTLLLGFAAPALRSSTVVASRTCCWVLLASLKTVLWNELLCCPVRLQVMRQ